jgi:hypothetical protein
MRKLLLIIIPLSISLSLFAGDAQDMLSGRGSVRALAMGGAYTAVAGDPASMHWNPAGLAGIGGQQISSEYGRLFEEITRFGLNYSNELDDSFYSVLKDSVLGIALVQESISNILQTSADASGFGVIDGSYSDSKTALGFSLAKRSGNYLLGASLKYYTYSHSVYNASAFGLDLGGIWQYTPELALGIALKNILGPQLKWNTPSGHADNIPLVMAVGAAYKTMAFNNDLLLAIDYRRSVQGDLCLGAEYSINKYFVVRAGNNSNGLALGLGINYQKFRLDYVLMNNSDLGGIQQLSIGLVLAESSRADQAVVRKAPVEKENAGRGEKVPAKAPAEAEAVELVPITVAPVIPGLEELNLPEVKKLAAKKPLINFELQKRTKEEKIALTGKVLNAKKFLIDGRTVSLRPDGRFYHKVLLSKGENVFVFQAVGVNGETIKSTKTIILE